MSFWDDVSDYEASKQEDRHFWDKVGDPIDREQQTYRDITDTLLDNKRIESLLARKLPDSPIGYQPTEDDRQRLTAVMDDHPNPEEFRAQLAVSLYLSNAYNEDFGRINSNHKAIREQLWGEGTTSVQALDKILKADREAFGLHRPIDYKGFWQATKDAYSQAGVGMVSEVAGLSRGIGERRSSWSREKVDWAEDMTEWGDVMYKGVLEYYKEHPEEFIQAKGEGFWDTTAEYFKHPVSIYQGILQTAPLILEGIAGGVIAGGAVAGVGAGAKATKFATWLGRVEGMATPIMGRKYAELRELDVPVNQAFPQAFLTGQIEGIIEEWVLGKKLAIFKGAGVAAKTGIVNRAVRTIIGGAKAYGRGVAEEGSQQFSENFWNWVFTDRDQELMDNVMSSAAAGGPMEMFMAGGFHLAGQGVNKFAKEGQVGPEQKLKLIEAIREKALDADLSPQEINEVNGFLDEAKTKAEVELEVTEAPAEAPVAEPPAEGIKVPPKPTGATEGGFVISEHRLKSGKLAGIHKTIEGVDPETGEKRTLRLFFKTDGSLFDAQIIRADGTVQSVGLGKFFGDKAKNFEGARDLTVDDDLSNPELQADILERVDSVFSLAEAPKPTEVKPEPQNIFEEIDQVEIVESDKDIPPMTTAGGTLQEQIEWKRTTGETVNITRGELTTELNRLTLDLDKRLAQNKIRTEEDVKQAEADADDLQTMREALGFAKGVRPFKVIRAKGVDIRVFKNVKSRIWAAIKGVPEVTTVAQALRNVMKGMSKAARQGYMQGARDQLALHKNLNKYAKEQLRGLDLKKSQMSKLMTAISNAKTENQRIAAHALIDILAEQSRQAKATAALRKTVAYINRKIGLAMQKKGLRPEYYEKIKAITDTFKLKPDPAKMARAVRSLKIHLENLQGTLSNQYAMQHEIEMIPDSMIKRLDKINAVPVREMTANEIDYLNDTLKQLIHNNETKNRLILRGIARELAINLNGAIAELENVRDNTVDQTGKPATEQNISPHGILTNFLSEVGGNKNHNLETLTDTVAGGQLGHAYQTFSEGISEGRDNANAYQNKVRDIFRAAMVKHKVSFADLQVMSKSFLRAFKGEYGLALRRAIGQAIGKELTPQLHTIKIDGTPQQFTMGELMMVYMHAQAGYNLKAMTENGVATWNQKLGKMSVSEVAIAAEIVENDPKAKAFVDMAAEVYETISKVELNRVSRGLMGIDIAKEENWAHVERYKTGGVAGAQRYRLRDIEQLGLLQERVGGKAPIIIRDFFDQFFVDMQSVSEYVGMAEPLRNARNLINYKAYRDRLREKGYSNELALMDSAIHNIQELPTKADAIDHVISFLMRGTIRAVLAEPGIFLGQYTSVNGIFNEMSRKYMSALRITVTAEQRAKYMDNIPSVKSRIEGGVSSNALGFLAQSDAVSKAFTGKGDVISLFTTLIHKVDSLAIIDICRTVEAEMADSNLEGKSKDYWENRSIEPAELEIGSEEYWDFFGKRANFLIRRTQPMFTPESQSAHTSAKGATKKMFFLFRSYIDQPLRMAARSVTAYRNGRISLGQLSSDLANVHATLALYSLVRFAVAALFYRKEDDWKDLVFSMLIAPARLLAWIGFPIELIAKNSIEKARRPEITTVPLNFANNVLESITLISEGIRFSITGEKYKSGPNKGKSKGAVILHKGFLRLSQNALMFYGVPEDVPRKIYNGWLKEDEQRRRKY